MNRLDELVNRAYLDELKEVRPVPFDEKSILKKTLGKLDTQEPLFSVVAEISKETELPKGYTEAVPKGAKKRRAAVLAVSAIAACFLLLFGVNAVSPQLTESIPSIGSLFRSMNGHETDPVPPENTSLPAATGDEGYFDFRVLDAYYNEREIMVSAELKTDLNIRESNTIIYEITLGKSTHYMKENSLHGWNLTGEETYTNKNIRFSIPNSEAPLQGNVTVKLTALYTDTTIPEQNREYQSEVEFTAACGLSDVAEINQEVEQNGVRFRFFRNSESSAEIIVDCPKTPGGQYWLEIYKPDGSAVNAASNYTDESNSNLFSGTNTICSQLSAPVPEDQTIIVSVMYEPIELNSETLPEETAEFTVDLSSKTVTATEQYKNPESPLFWNKVLAESATLAYPYYRATEENLQELADGYKVEFLSQCPIFGTNTTYLNLVTDREYRDLRVYVKQNGISLLTGASSKTLDEAAEKLFYSFGASQVAGKTLFQPFPNYRLADSYLTLGSMEGSTIYTGGETPRESAYEGLNSQIIYLERGINPVVLVPGQEYILQLYEGGNLLYEEKLTISSPENDNLEEGKKWFRLRGSNIRYALVTEADLNR